MLEINFNNEDTMYILGDVVDRGPESILALKHIAVTNNIFMLMGNHEQMMLDAVTTGKRECLELWINNGGYETFKGFYELPKEEQKEIITYLSELPYIRNVKVNAQNYVLVHAGINMGTNWRIFKGRLPTVSTADIIKRQRVDDVLWIRNKFI